ncbi:IclR family transcriptional regulator [Robbsia sp. Bb-Pol-6]|uniref:IclR family transcriptional regulator n=1 Tax=Robbsia betulipollinis TaxID=2981849 RepID=A0ABT3ZSF0_9BURK|nr:IclR family transcriptional regulator [Robbsia betulipollinis]MCY0389466.1 IclR family transcriptional regulator [Robbsia betulipollinis]
MSILETASAVLQLMAARQAPLTVSELVEALQMPKSTASRVLRQMGEQRLLTRDAVTLAYRPAPLLLELAHLVRSSTPLIDMCARALDALGEESGHTGYVSVLEGNDVMTLRVRPGSQPLRARTNPGHRSPSWATSTGRALLARESGAAIAVRFAAGLSSPLAHRPPGGPATLDELHAALDAVRRERFAIAENEAFAGICSIGSAVADPASGECLAFCLTFPSGMLSHDAKEALATRVRAQAERIGRAVGDPFWTAGR